MKFEYNQQSGTYEGYCMIKSCEQKVTAKGMPYLDLILADADGEIISKYWDYNPAAGNVFEAGDIVKVRGTIGKYNGVDQFRVERIRAADDNDPYDINDIVKSSEYEGEVILKRLSCIYLIKIMTSYYIGLRHLSCTMLFVAVCFIIRFP